MSDNFEHKMQKIELPNPQRPVHRLSVPGGWLYAWVGGICFVPHDKTPRPIRRAQTPKTEGTDDEN